MPQVIGPLSVIGPLTTDVGFEYMSEDRSEDVINDGAQANASAEGLNDGAQGTNDGAQRPSDGAQGPNDGAQGPNGGAQGPNDSAQASVEQPFFHIPVLSGQVMEGLQVKPGGRYLDATVGGGGHSQLILQAAPEVELVALDQDLQALAAAKARLAEYGDRVTFHHTNFSKFKPQDLELSGGFDGILADIGVSSTQLDQAQRGFSFRQEAPLDMRMDDTQELTAEDIVNHWDEKTIADTIYEYGEERLSRRIARRIIEKRPFTTTTELAWEVAGAYPAKARHGRIHPATRTFQALRIAVNGELTVLKELLAAAPDWLNPGGRLAIISFHSLEDRIVKYAYRGDERLQIITKKPLVATREEIRENKRSRSAKLRIAERKAPTP